MQLLGKYTNYPDTILKTVRDNRVPERPKISLANSLVAGNPIDLLKGILMKATNKNCEVGLHGQ